MGGLSRAAVAAVAAAVLVVVATAAAGTLATTQAGAAPGPSTASPQLPGGRAYTLHAANWTGGARPLVVALHGVGQSAARMAQITGLDAIADTYRLVVAYGQAAGTGARWNAGSCCGSTEQDEVSYVRAVVADAAARTPVDLTRVYVVGYSNGGMLAWRLACQARDLVAAVAVVAGALLVPCRSTPAVRAYHIHGTGDATVPLAGGRGFEGRTFPDSRTEPARVGPGSTVRQHWFAGGHLWPAWATPTVLSWLLRYRVIGSATPRPPAKPGPVPINSLTAAG